jgi:2-amino-4-hydroxy-6-hydroxymethyldihydropteridine diphosphokinase
MVTAYIALGSNLGDRLAYLRAALKALSEHPEVSVDFDSDVASLYETSPVGGPAEQNAFFNSVVRIATQLSPISLLDVLLSIEDALGRRRGAKWGQRCIDLDLLLSGDVVSQSDRLVLPHPRLHQRRFVLEPLGELAAQLVHPLLHISVADLARAAAESKLDERVIAIMPHHWPQTEIETPLVRGLLG